MKSLTKLLLLGVAVATVACLSACQSNDKKNSEATKTSSASSAAPTPDATSAPASSAEEVSVEKDLLNGKWRQTDATNGDWEWTFDGTGKCHLTGITTGFETDGTYVLDETAKTVAVTMDNWSDPKTYEFTLADDILDLKEKYSHYHLIKQ